MAIGLSASQQLARLPLLATPDFYHTAPAPAPAPPAPPQCFAVEYAGSSDNTPAGQSVYFFDYGVVSCW